MDINTLKEYAKINRKRLAPTADDCVNAQEHAKFKEDLGTILTTDKFAHGFVKSVKKDMFRYFDMTLSFYVIACLPFLIFFLPIFDGEPLVYDSVKYQTTLGSAGWLVYILTAAVLAARVYFNRRGSNMISTAAAILRFALLIVCAFLGGIRNVTLFGSEYAWFFVLLVGGGLITLLSRLIDSRRVNKAISEYDKGAKLLSTVERLIDGDVKLFNKLGDKRAAELKALCPELPLTSRTAWFDLPREYNKKGKFIKPRYRSVDSDFTAPFSGETEYTAGANMSKKTEYTIHSQSYGYKLCSAKEAKALVDSGKVVPFYNYELPEFIDGLEYNVLRHTWDITKSITTRYSQVMRREVDSLDQLAFDGENAMREYLFLGKGIDELDREYFDDPIMQTAIQKYKKKVSEKRSEIGSDFEEFVHESEHFDVVEMKGDEIGIMTVRTPDGELVGVYSGESIESIMYTYNTIKDETGFAISTTMSANGQTQRALLYNAFVK